MGAQVITGQDTWRVRIVKPAETLGRYEHGVDYGVRRVVVAVITRGGDVSRLIWIPGHKGWFKVGESAYYPGHLTLLRAGEAGSFGYPVGCGLASDETRLVRLLKTSAAAIAELIQIPVDLVLEHFQRGRTVYLTR